MATATNHLTSHHGEHQSYPTDRMIPKAVMRSVRIPYGKHRPNSSVSQLLKRVHNRRSRRYMLKQAYQAAAEYATCPRSTADSATVS